MAADRGPAWWPRIRKGFPPGGAGGAGVTREKDFPGSAEDAAPPDRGHPAPRRVPIRPGRAETALYARPYPP